MLTFDGLPADKEEVVHVTNDRTDAVAAQSELDGWPAASGAPMAIVEGKRTRKQREAAAILTADARCTPVLVRAAITGPARMPRAALEILAPDRTPIGHVALVNTTEELDLQQRFWLVGDIAQGAVVALVSEHRAQVVLPGGRLRLGPAPAQEWSDIACRMLGWQRRSLDQQAPAEFHAVFTGANRTVDGDEFARAVKRFRFAAVTIPVIFFAFCFPYLFVIPWAVHAGYSMPALLALPVVGGAAMTMWSAHCRRELGVEAEQIEAGGARWAKEIAYTQSYWTSMRRPSEPWTGALPDAAR